MARAYSIDLRERVIQANRDEGLSARAAAQRFGVGVTTAIVWIRRFTQQGETAPRRQGARYGCRLEPHKRFILGLIEQRKDITLAEIVEQLMCDRGVQVSITTVWYWLDRQGLTYKKNGARRRTATPRRGGSSPGLV